MAQTPAIPPLPDLLAGCLRQHRRSQEMLYRQFYGYAMSICLRYTQTREEAVEVLNDGFYKVFTKIDHYDPAQPFKPWLRRVLINTATDYYRQAAPHYYQNDLLAAEHLSSPDADALSGLSHEYLLSLVQRLTPAYRVVFNLYAIDGYTHEEIAQQLGISVGASKSNLARARENLRLMLQKKRPMIMEEWPDNHLDDLFRKSAEEYDAPFDTADWAALSCRLDEHDRATWFERITRWSGLGTLLLLLLGGLSWVMLSSDAPRHRPQRATNPAAQASRHHPAAVGLPTARGRSARAERLVAQKPGDAAASFAVQRQQTTRSEMPRRPVNRQPAASVRAGNLSGRLASARPQLPIVRRPPAPASRQVRVDRTDSIITVGASEPRSDAYSPTGRAGQPRRQQTDRATSVGNVPGDVGVLDNEPLETAASETAIAVDPRWLPVLTPLPTLSAVAQLTMTNVPEVQEVTIDQPTQRPAPRLSRFSVFVFASPDLSAIGLKNFERPGSNMGFAVQYQLTDRLSLNTGAMLSTKVYSAAADEYDWPFYSKWLVWPVGVDGKCTMIDVPLNLRYDWLLRPRGDGRPPAGLPRRA